jgi:hypothetical protein
MIIRKEQSNAFRQQMATSFEDRMAAQLRESLPDETRHLNDAAVRADIRAGMTRAAQYDIQTERDVARFIDLLFRVGRDFDTSPTTPWARQILLDKASSADNRLRRLQIKAQEVLETGRAAPGRAYA